MLYSSWRPETRSVSPGVVAAGGRFGQLGKRGEGESRRRRWMFAYLARHVDDLGGVLLSFEFDQFAKRVFDGRIVAVHKWPTDISHRE